MRGPIGALAIALCTSVAAAPASQSDTLIVPTFGQVVIYAPPDPPGEVVLFVSGDGGWNLGVVPMAQHLRDLGALVVGIDIRSFTKNLEASSDCAYPAGSLEELSRAIQIRYKLPAYKPPVLVGYSSGATLVYAVLAQAPSETFAGAVSLGFCPSLEMHTPPCSMRGLKVTKKAKPVGYELAPFAGLSVPWMVLQGELDQVCAPATTRAFVTATGSARLFSLPSVGHGFGVPGNWEPQFIDAYRAIVRRQHSEETAHASVPEVADLPLVEVPAADGSKPGLMAVVLSGDGGWVEIDKSIAAGLAAKGVPTVGWSSLRYFWTPRTPKVAAADLGRIITHYANAWNRQRVVLVGYSFGADVLPFLVTRLSPDATNRVAHVVLLGPSQTAMFEFHVAEWFGGGQTSVYRTAPEVERLTMPVTCVYGTDETDSACHLLKGKHITAVSAGQGHHFGGDYGRLVEVILSQR